VDHPVEGAEVKYRITTIEGSPASIRNMERSDNSVDGTTCIMLNTPVKGEDLHMVNGDDPDLRFYATVRRCRHNSNGSWDIEVEGNSPAEVAMHHLEPIKEDDHAPSAQH
jgi:hypothetical protein